MRVLYFDCFSGISGDMCLGALVDAGVKFSALKREVSKLGLTGYTLSAKRVWRCGIGATSVSVKLKGRQHARKWADIEGIISGSALGETVKARSLACFELLFKAEGKVHGAPPKDIHLHELGATDALVDITGTMAAVELLGVDQVYCSAINVGAGTVKAAHGVLPVPAPATELVLRGMPIYSSGPAYEMTTPTGAAIAATLSRRFGPMPAMSVTASGYGAGGRDPQGHPNVLRVMLGEPAAQADDVWVIEANIDDMNPQVYAYASERLFEAGALDVWMTPVMMKKARPATVLSVLCDEAAKPRVIETLFRQTTTIGVRHHKAARTVLERKITKAKTPWGVVRVKVSSYHGKVMRATPEYEDCANLAREFNVPLLEVIEAARGRAS